MAKAYQEGFFQGYDNSLFRLERDNNLRTDTSMEKLAKLKPALIK